MNSIGATIKKIRNSKGLTQTYITNNAQLTQSNYSKFEKGLIDLRATTFINILDTIDIPLQEFMYIHNGYKLSYKEDTLNKFFNVPYHNIEALNEIQQDCLNYLIYQDSATINDINNLCKALTVIYEHNDFHEAQKIANSIWTRLSKNNELSLYDLYFLNAILYIFSIDEVLQLRNFLSRGYAKYKDYPNTLPIFINTYINISLLLIENQKYEEALKDLEFVHDICKNQRLFFKLAIVFIRKGICMSNLNGDGDTYIEKGLHWLESFEETAAITIMKEEVNTYFNLTKESNSMPI